MAPRRQPVLLVLIVIGWLLFLVLFSFLAGPLGIPLIAQVAVLVAVIGLLIHLVARDVWRNDR